MQPCGEPEGELPEGAAREGPGRSRRAGCAETEKNRARVEGVARRRLGHSGCHDFRGRAGHSEGLGFAMGGKGVTCERVFSQGNPSGVWGLLSGR